MKYFFFWIVFLGTLVSCSLSHTEETYRQIQKIDSVFRLKNYYSLDEDEINSYPEYSDIVLSMKVYESDQETKLMTDSIPFLKGNTMIRKKYIELAIDNWMDYGTFSQRVNAQYLINEFPSSFIGKEDEFFLKNAEILESPHVSSNGDRNFVISFILGIPETDRIYRCSMEIDIMGYSKRVDIIGRKEL